MQLSSRFSNIDFMSCQSVLLEQIIEIFSNNIHMSVYAIILGCHYWYLVENNVILLIALIACIVMVSAVLIFLAQFGIERRDEKIAFFVALLPMVALQTFIMWKVFDFNLSSVALPYGVVAVVLIAIKFLVSKKNGDVIKKNDIKKYDGMFHIVSLRLVSFSMFPVCAIKILDGVAPFSKLAESVFVTDELAKSLFMIITKIFVFASVLIVAFAIWMLVHNVFISYDSNDINNFYIYSQLARPNSIIRA